MNEILENHMADDAHGWIDERRHRQAAVIHRWWPWASATGPRTPVGKAASSRNASRPNSVRRQLLPLVTELKAAKPTRKNGNF
jgi:hypothetical protein